MVRKIPLASMERVMRDVGADRVSDDSKEALREVLEEQGKLLTKKAFQLSKHAERRTILKEDVKLAKD